MPTVKLVQRDRREFGNQDAMSGTEDKTRRRAPLTLPGVPPVLLPRYQTRPSRHGNLSTLMPGTPDALASSTRISDRSLDPPATPRLTRTLAGCLPFDEPWADRVEARWGRPAIGESKPGGSGKGNIWVRRFAATWHVHPHNPVADDLVHALPASIEFYSPRSSWYWRSG
jgi:hypothetical protein